MGNLYRECDLDGRGASHLFWNGGTAGFSYIWTVSLSGAVLCDDGVCAVSYDLYTGAGDCRRFYSD